MYETAVLRRKQTVFALDAQEKDPPIIKDAPTITGYTILSQLGKGGMATVYLAIQECFGRKVALKVMRPNAHEDSSYGERFIREAKIVARLSHPNIVPVYDVGVAGDHYYIAMEYLNGGDLTSKVRRGLKLSEVLQITKDTALALDYAHRKGYVHRDVKPDNIMFREDGTAVLTDFGIARPAAPDSNMTQVGKVIGTPKYMSPEQTKGEEIDNTSDLYALGIMLFEMLTGKVPFDGKDPFEIGIKHLKDPVPRLPSSVGVFQSLVDQLLAKNKFKRIQSGREVVDIIDGILHKSKASSRVTQPARQAPLSRNDETQVRENPTGMHADVDDRRAYQPAPAKKSSPVTTILLVLLLLAGGAFAAVWFAPQYAQGTPLMDWNAKLMALLNPAPPEPVKPKVDPIAEKIKASLEKAQAAMALGNYVTPFGESALDHYRAALALDAENTTAKLGVADVATKLVAQAMEAIQIDALDKARDLLSQARSISANIPGLATAENQLKMKEQALANAADQARQAEAQRQAAEAARRAEEERRLAAEAKRRAEEEAKRLARQKQLEEEERLRQEELARQQAQADAAQARFKQLRIKGLIAKADTYFSRGDYYSPSTDNALDKYQEVLSLETSNTDALAGLNKVIAIIIPEIEKMLENQQPDAAKALYDRAISAAPENAELLMLGQSKGW